VRVASFKEREEILATASYVARDRPYAAEARGPASGMSARPMMPSASCGIGSCGGGAHLSLADYVTGMGAPTGATAAGAC